MFAHVAQLVEHVLGKDEVSGSIPLVGSTPVSGVGRRDIEKAYGAKVLGFFR